MCSGCAGTVGSRPNYFLSNMTSKTSDIQTTCSRFIVNTEEKKQKNCQNFFFVSQIFREMICETERDQYSSVLENCLTKAAKMTIPY